jgi:ketosteroid isomerase-like protein
VDVRELIPLEEAFWRAAGDADAYASHLAADAVHVFPAWGVAEREAVLAGVRSAAPWTSFAIEEPRVVALGDDAAALVYVARATRGGEEYHAAITSVYRSRDDGWELVVHQQTPL